MKNWLRTLIARPNTVTGPTRPKMSKGTASRRASLAARLAMQPLEDRTVPTVYLNAVNATPGFFFTGQTAIADAINSPNATPGTNILVNNDETYGDFIVAAGKDNLTIAPSPNAIGRPVVFASGNGATATISAAGTTIEGLQFNETGPGFVNASAIRINNTATETTIRDNVINGNNRGIDVIAGLNASGSAVFGAMIEQNTIDGNVEGLRFTGGLGATNEVTVRNNFITNNAPTGSPAGSAGVRLLNGFLGTDNVFRHNTISGNGTSGGVLNQSVTSANFSVNYWGTSDGPGSGANGPGTGNPVSANVDITPFIVDGTDIAPATAGYQPDLDELTVHTLNSQIGTTGRVQEGIDEVNVGGIVNALAGTYKENPNANKAVTLRGANVGVAGYDPRGAESIVSTNGNQSAVFTISADNVTIDGFTIDGYDALAMGTDLTSGDTTSVLYTIRASGAGDTGILAQNNILTRAFIGFRGDGVLGTPVANNTITRNLFDSIGFYDFGYAVTLRTDFYADVTNNVMTRVQSGLHTNGHSSPSPSGSWSFQNNTVEAYGAGVWHNQQYGTATALTIDGNTISSLVAPATAANAAVRVNYDNDSVGILLTYIGIGSGTGFVVTNNDVSDTDYGVTVLSIDSTALQTIGGTNDIHDNGVGVYLTNIVDFNPVTTTPLGTTANFPTGLGRVNLTGLDLVDNATGILVRGDNPSSTFGVELTLGAGNTVTGGTTGLRVQGADTAIAGDTLNDIAFTGQTGDYITLADGALFGEVIDGSDASYDGVVGGAATGMQPFAIEAKIFHLVDDNTLGLIDFGGNGSIYVVPVVNDTATTNDYTVIRNAIEAVPANGTVNLYNNGTFFDWTETNAAASWAAGNDDIVGTGDDYGLYLLPANRNGVTVTAPLGANSARILGPGDLPTVDLEGVFFAYAGDGNLQDWTFSNLLIDNFDVGFLFFYTPAAGEVDAFDGLTITNNTINLATDSTVDAFQNIAIHYSFGSDQTISNNTINMTPGSTSASVSVAMQSNSLGTPASIDGLMITGNIINVAASATPADPGVILGIWENSNAFGGDITVSNNQFLGDAANTLTSGRLTAFRITSASNPGGTVLYEGNVVQNASTGFLWEGSINFAGTQATQLKDNTLTNVYTGVRLRSSASASFSGNSFTNTTLLAGSVGIEVTDSAVATFVSGTTRNVVQGYETGVRFADSGSGNVAELDFDGTLDNGTDVRIDFDAGTVTFGNNVDFAGDTFYIDLLSTQNVDLASLSGIAYDVGSTAVLANNFRIEDLMHHRVDTDLALTNGLITWVTGNLYVTTPGGASTDSTIQRGIDAATATNTVNVENGTYNEDVVVTKSLTLLGDQRNVDPRLGRAGPESIIAGLGVNAPVQVLAGVTGVVINGFTINSPAAGSGAFNGGIYLTGGNTGMDIRNNILENNTAGVAIGAGTDGSITLNLIRNNNRPGSGSGNGVEFFAPNSGTWTVSNNRFTSGNDNADIIIAGGSPVSNVTISGNDFVNGTGNGIAVFAANSLQILGNNFSGTDFSAINIGGGVTNATISGNTFTDLDSRAILVRDAGYALGAQGPITISSNTVNQNLGLFSANRSIFDLSGITSTLAVTGNTMTLTGTPTGGATANGIEIGDDVAGAQTVTGNTVTGANGAALLLSGSATNGIATVGGVGVGNTFTGNRTGVDIGSGTRAVVLNNTVTGNGTGVSVNGGTALLQGNNLDNNTTAGTAGGGLVVQGNGVVDAGGTTNTTGLGISTGGNSFLGYTPGSNYAIVDINTGPDVNARFNDFDGTTYGDIEARVFHHVDLPLFSYVIYTNAVGAAAPAVETVRYLSSTTAPLNELPSQRSLIRVIDVVIDGPVFGDAVAALGLDRVGGTTYDWYTGLLRTGDVFAIDTPTITSSVDGATGRTTFRIAFANTGAFVNNDLGAGRFTEYGSLIDGNYTLNLDGSGLELLAPGSGQTVANNTTNFYRFFGDLFSTDRAVTTNDRGAFNEARTNPASLYRKYLDFDLSGNFAPGSNNVTQFNNRFQQELPAPPPPRPIRIDGSLLGNTRRVEGGQPAPRPIRSGGQVPVGTSRLQDDLLP